jgi:hypothetical protein
MSTLNREEYIAAAVKKAGEDFDRMVHKQNVEDKFADLGKTCTYTSPFMEGMLPEIHVKDVSTLQEAVQIYEQLYAVKSYYHKNGTVATELIAPENEKSVQYDMQVRFDPNATHGQPNTTVSFVVFKDEYYKFAIKLNSGLFRVNGNREEHMGGYIIKGCTLTYSNPEFKDLVVDQIKWGGDTTRLNCFSMFLKLK